MKRILTTLVVFLSMTIGCLAQKYVVYTIIGKPNVITKKGKRPLLLRDQLTPASTIVMPYESRLELIDIDQKEQIIIKTSGTGTVDSFIKNKQNAKLKPSKRFFAYILSRIKGNEETVVRSCSDPATVTREELVDSLYQELPY